MKNKFLPFLSLLLILTIFTACNKVKTKLPNDTSINLAGGSEAQTREQYPISNYALSKQYPNSLIMKGPDNIKLMALTFDDGPDNHLTPEVLDVLKKHNVKATFFLLGSRIKKFPEVAKRINAEGHKIGMHSYSHPNLYKKSINTLKDEINKTQNVMVEKLGFGTSIFRAPYGNIREDQLKYLKNRNITTIGWNVDSLDWKGLDVEQIEKNVLSDIKPGAIILMHSAGNWNQGYSSTTDALDKIIKKLKKDGVQFVTIDKFLKNKPNKK